MATPDQKARINRGQKALWRLIQEAEAGAAEMCDDGEFEASAALHEMAANLRQAYAKGRALRIGGEFVALSGEK